MLARTTLSSLLLAGIFCQNVHASTDRKDLIHLDKDEDSLTQWVNTKNLSIKNLLCVDKLNAISFSLNLLNQSPLCRKIPSTDQNFSESGISSISEIVNATMSAPATRAEFKTVEASRYLIKSSFASAFLPTVELSDAFIKRSDSKEKVASRTTRYITSIDPNIGSSVEPSWSYDETSSFISPQYYGSFAISIPIYKPFDIQYYSYYKSSDKASAFSSTASIDSQIKSSLQNAISLWVSSKQIKMNELNVIAAIESLESTVGLYKIGSSAKPDIAESLATLRSYQSSLASEYDAYLNSFNSLAFQIGLKPSDLKLHNNFFKVEFLDPVLNYEEILDSSTLQSSVTNNNTVYYYLYLSSSYLDLGKSYLASYLPEINLSLGYSYASNDEIVSTRSCTSSWNCTLSSKEKQFSSTTEPSIALNFTWTLFDSGSSYFKYKSNKKTAQSNFDQAVNSAYEAVESITTYFQKQSSLDDEIAFNYSSLSASEVAYRENLLAYKSGFSDTTSLVQRLDSLVTSRSNYLASLKDNLINKVDIMETLRSGIYANLNYFDLDYNQDLTDKLNVIRN